MNTVLQQTLLWAMSFYYDVAALVAEAIQRNGDLGLLSPGSPFQLMLADGVSIETDGTPLYRVIARRSKAGNNMTMLYFRAVQAAIDAACYRECYPRLQLLYITPLSGGYVGLTLTWGCW